MTKGMDMEFLLRQMEEFIKGNIIMEKNMVKDIIKVLMVSKNKVNGRKVGELKAMNKIKYY